MKRQSISGILIVLGALALTGCASGPGGSIYVPPNSSPDYGTAPEPPQSEPEAARPVNPNSRLSQIGARLSPE